MNDTPTCQVNDNFSLINLQLKKYQILSKISLNEMIIITKKLCAIHMKFILWIDHLKLLEIDEFVSYETEFFSWFYLSVDVSTNDVREFCVNSSSYLNTFLAAYKMWKYNLIKMRKNYLMCSSECRLFSGNWFS